MASTADSYPPAPLNRLLEALVPDMPPKIARAVVDTTMKRERVRSDLPPSEALPIMVEALERTLPMFIMDVERRRKCIARLRRLHPEAPPLPAAPRSPLPSSPEVAEPSASGRRLVSPPPPPARPPSDPELDAVTVLLLAPPDLGRAVDEARALSKRIGFNAVEQTKIATAVAELARNIQLYARRGEVRLEAVRTPRKGIEVTALDEGPGIADVEAVMGSAYRSKTGMGMGLKGAKRLMDAFAIESAPGIGTRVTARRYLK